SLGVALRKNSSMPGLIIHTKSPILSKLGAFCMNYENREVLSFNCASKLIVIHFFRMILS
ncbi:MAG: hypothetical protein V7K53_33995, partial [Nostoc sp.]|uniref:hypothetical protein n=1 Tax=Nostoc sp. TaxID=1180 RepID=UPI002FFA066D